MSNKVRKLKNMIKSTDRTDRFVPKIDFDDFIKNRNFDLFCQKIGHFSKKIHKNIPFVW